MLAGRAVVSLEHFPEVSGLEHPVQLQGELGPQEIRRSSVLEHLPPSLEAVLAKACFQFLPSIRFQPSRFGPPELRSGRHELLIGHVLVSRPCIFSRFIY